MKGKKEKATKQEIPKVTLRDCILLSSQMALPLPGQRHEHMSGEVTQDPTIKKALSLS